MILLPARCDRAAVEALLPEILAEVLAAPAPKPLRIDGSGARQIGQAMLQLLVSARRTGAGAIIIPSPALRDAARLTGLDTALFDEAVA